MQSLFQRLDFISYHKQHLGVGWRKHVININDLHYNQ